MLVGYIVRTMAKIQASINICTCLCTGVCVCVVWLTHIIRLIIHRTEVYTSVAVKVFVLCGAVNVLFERLRAVVTTGGFRRPRTAPRDV